MLFPLRSITRQAVLIAFAGAMVSACGGGGGDSQQGGQDTWLIPLTYVADGGPGVDGIPALEGPVFESAATITTVAPQDLVVAVRSEGQVKVYPHDIMDYHEIVNDGLATQPFIMSYCPLTGSAVAWPGRTSDVDSTFGVSGLLYNSNLILYDRQTETLWSQMLEIGVNGPRISQTPTNLPLVETTFETVMSMYPDAVVMTRDTGHDFPYDEYPYGDYLDRHNLLFPVARQDGRMGNKQRVVGIHEVTNAKVYQLGAFGATTQTINDQFNEQPIVVVGNSAMSFGIIYSRELADGTILSFEPLQDDLPNVMADSEGNVWDIFGQAVSGPRVGEQLDTPQSYIAYWFAWAAHFDQVEIHFN